MKVCNESELLNSNINVIFLNVLQQFWHNTKSFSCIGSPKEQNLLLYLNGCKITYTTKSGKTLVAESGDIIYVPSGIEYKATLSEFESNLSHTIGINFMLYDENGESLVLSDKIKVFSTNNAASLFSKLLKQDAYEPLLKKKILLSEILYSLTSFMPTSDMPDGLSKAIEYLAEHIEENPTVSELAAISAVSEVYFRKQFREFFGMSPVKYRSKLRLNKAMSYLEYGNISIQEISDTLGYSTASYFIKEFKENFGCSPYKYKAKKLK